jgi:CRP-like cAMP-binding protein
LEQILNHIKKIYPLKKGDLDLLTRELNRIELPKNHLIIRSDRIERSLYFIERGVARAYCDGKDNQITFWFGMEGDAIFSYHSYIHGTKGYENIVLLENSVLYEIKTETLQGLFSKHIELANWGRKFAERELIKTEERFIGRLFTPAADRYAELIKNAPTVVQRVQLGYIASYLGVTQVTLSRIRAELRSVGL